MGLFDFGNFDFSSPTPTYFPRNQGMGSFDFPSQSFRDDSFASFMNPSQNYMPMTQDYFSALQNAPTREEYKPSLGRKIGAGLAGLAASFTNPQAAGDITFGALNAPFMRAQGDYQQRLGNLAQGARGEQGLAALARQMSADEFERSKFGQELGFKESELAQKGALGGREIDLKGRILESDLKQKELDRALAEKRISTEQYNSATQRMNAETQRQSANDPMRYLGAVLSGVGSLNRAGAQGQPSAAMTDTRISATIQTDPVLNKYIKSDGNIDIAGIRDDPNAAERLAEIYRQLGVTQSNDIRLGSSQVQPPNDIMSIIQQLQGMRR